MNKFERTVDKLLGESPVEAPPIPKRGPVRPQTPPPGKPGKTKPWAPPKPKVVPTPKNHMGESRFERMVLAITEAYEDEAHPHTVGFWRNLRRSDHAMSKHPIFSAFGHDLSKAGWEQLQNRARQMGLNVRDTMRIIQQVMGIEREHAQELIELAKKITVQIWGVPEEILNGRLTNNVETGSTSDEIEWDGETTTPDESEVHKRMTLNTLTHGSAVHAMLSMHHLVDEEIRRIDPRLLDLYNKLSTGSHQYYWLMDIPSMLENLSNIAIGSTNVNYRGEEGNETPTVDARAICFPVLAQEMSKGVAELISHHGLAGKDEAETRGILAAADDIRHEPYMIQIGPELWRRFLKVKPRDISLADLYQALSTQTPQELHRLVYKVIKEPDEAREILQDLIREPEEFNIGDWEGEDEGPNWGDEFDDEGGQEEEPDWGE